jgi:cytochrome P450
MFCFRFLWHFFFSTDKNKATDTTATGISSTIFYLLHNPACWEKLAAEIRPRFQHVEEIRGGGRLAECQYLRACIDEAMRMTPGVGGILPREVLAGGIVVDGVAYPAGVDVGVPIYAVQHDEAYYPRPFEYVPERWIVDPDEKADDSGFRSADAVALARSAFAPFSLGPWSCAGKGMALKEITLVVARLVYLFDIRIVDGTRTGEGDPTKSPATLRHRPGELQGKDRFLTKTDGPTVQFKLRDEARA